MATLVSFTNNDSHNLEWVVGATYMVQRAHSLGAAIYDTILGYDEHGFVVVIRKQDGEPDRITTHITPHAYGKAALVSIPAWANTLNY